MSGVEGVAPGSVPATSTRLYLVLLPVSAASSSPCDRPVVGDQKPATGTSATMGGVGMGVGIGIGVGVAISVRLGSRVGEGVPVGNATLVGSSSDRGDGRVGPHDTRMAAITVAPMDRRTVLERRTRPA
jgi:hypothetical protein